MESDSLNELDIINRTRGEVIYVCLKFKPLK